MKIDLGAIPANTSISVLIEVAPLLSFDEESNLPISILMMKIRLLHSISNILPRKEIHFNQLLMTLNPNRKLALPVTDCVDIEDSKLNRDIIKAEMNVVRNFVKERLNMLQSQPIAIDYLQDIFKTMRKKIVMMMRMRMIVVVIII